MTKGDHIIWHVPQPIGNPIIITGQVKHVNEHGAVVVQFVKDSKGNRHQIPEFYSWDELKRVQVMGHGQVCE